MMFCVLVIVLGSTEKATDCLKEKFDFAKIETESINFQSGSKKKNKNYQILLVF